MTTSRASPPAVAAPTDSDDDSDEEAPEVANAEDSDEDYCSTKIKMENLRSSPPRLRSRIQMAQKTGPAGPTAPAGRSVPGIVVKEGATKILTENIQTREESLKREMHDDVVEVDKIEDSNQVVEINIDEGDL